MPSLNIVVFGLSITSSWGNGHATTFRSLLKALNRRGHRITFFEKDVPWYADNRDLAKPTFCDTVLYRSLPRVDAHQDTLAAADLVIVGSFVSDAQALLQKIRRYTSACLAFYDIDTPVTLAKLERGDFDYLHPTMIPVFDLYLSFTGGPSLDILEQRWGARRARPLYCSVDPELYYPERYCPKLYPPEPRDCPAHTAGPPHYTLGYPAQTASPPHYTLGYLGTYSEDRQATLERLLLEPARQLPAARFCVAGAQYPAIRWPANVAHVTHIPPWRHRHFYNAQCFTLNITRQDMIAAGFSPSVRLFEAGACGTPVISDHWEGLDQFFTIGEDILVARGREDMLEYLHMDGVTSQAIGERMRRKVLDCHTAAHRAMALEAYMGLGLAHQ